MKPLLLVSEIEDYTISFANGLAQHVPVVLGVPARRYTSFAKYFHSGVDLRLLDWPRHSSAKNPAFLLSLTRLVRRERPSIVHLLSNNVLWLNFAAPLWRPIPLVTTVHDVEIHPGDNETNVLPGWATTLIARQSDGIVVHGESLRSLAVDRFRKPSDRVHVLSHPSIQHYTALAATEGLTPAADRPFTVLLFGRIMAYKGLATLLRAEKALAGRVPDLRITIAGRGDDPWSLQAEMGDPARYDVRRGWIEDRDVAQLFLDADVVVLPYSEASQSGVLNLAAAFGKPVIVTDVGELRATVEPNGIGLVVPPDDPGALAQAIASLAEQPERLAALGHAARIWADGPNAPETVGGHAVDLYRRIIEERAR
ncbi:MAG: glycosyltransferase family 4 protein [Amaricoccus sp.]|uniref:glycosyltransferase family 4 protein n=1 Tax=Amaricoccus sp. TaxID=1872485 RepID=UPI0039E6C749